MLKLDQETWDLNGMSNVAKQMKDNVFICVSYKLVAK